MDAECIESSALISPRRGDISAPFLLAQSSYLGPTAAETSKSGDGRGCLSVCLLRRSYLENGERTTLVMREGGEIVSISS